MSETLADGLSDAPADCARVDAALPWFVNGTLPAADRAVVAQHLERCAGCRQRASFETQLHDTVRATADGAGQPAAAEAQAAWERFAPQLEPAPGSAPSVSQASVRRSPGLRVRRLWMIVGAQAAALVLIALVLVVRETQRAEPVYRTVADAPRTITNAADRVLLRLVVAVDLPVTEVRRLAAEVGAVVVEGPSAEQVYTLALDKDRSAGAAMQALRVRRGVLLAEEVAR